MLFLVPLWFIFSMKILFLNHNVKGVGTYIRCWNFAKHLVQFGHDVTILTGTPTRTILPTRSMVDGVRVVCMPDILGRRLRNGGLGPIDTLLRCLYILDKPYDIVENFDHRPAVLYPALVSKYICRIPLVSEWTDLHGSGGSLNNRPGGVQSLIKPYENFTEQKSKKLPERLVVISQGLKRRAMRLGVPASTIRYIPGGADLEKIHIQPKDRIRQKFGLPLDRSIIAYTAGTQYNVEFLIDSVNYIQQMNKDVILVTTGDKMDEHIKAKLQDIDRVWELGFLSYDDYTALLPGVDVFMFPFTDLPLNRGRWPNKIGDYMAAGRPTVTNRTGDMIDLFETHDIGRLASEDAKEFAAKTIELIDNKNLADKLGQNARKAAEKHYDWKMLARNLEECFIEVLERN
jgi:glycosyltransferase involved in cell wall biosynthesis